MVFYQINMNSFNIYTVGLCFAILANSVSGDLFPTSFSRFETFAPPFYYSYMFSDINMNMIIKLRNPSQAIKSIDIIVETDGPLLKYGWGGGDQYTLRGFEAYKQVIVSLELHSSNGLCATREVAEGRHVDTLEHGMAYRKYNPNHPCIHIPDSACVVEVDLRNDCPEIEEADPVTTKRTIPRTPRPTQRTPKPTQRTPKPTQRTPKPTQRTPRPTQRTPRPTKRTPRPTQRTPRPTQRTPRPTHTTPKQDDSFSPRPTQDESVSPRPTQDESVSPRQDTSGTTTNTTLPRMPKTLQPAQNISNTNQNTSTRKTFTTQKPIQDNHANMTHNATSDIYATLNSTTADMQTATEDISDATRSTLEDPGTYNITGVSSDSEALKNQSDTSTASQFTIDDADVKKYITITVVSAVSVLALIMVVVVLRKYCRSKRHGPAGSSQLLASDLSSPFYLNMLFRKECDQEIELVEQHHYEEINPQ